MLNEGRRPPKGRIARAVEILIEQEADDECMAIR
jgi:hypothetical protein